MRWKRSNYLKLERKTLFSTSRYVCQSICCLSIKYSPFNILSTGELYRCRSNQISCFNRLIGFSISFFIRSSTLNLIVDLLFALCRQQSESYPQRHISFFLFSLLQCFFSQLGNCCEKRDFSINFTSYFSTFFLLLINMKF